MLQGLAVNDKLQYPYSVSQNHNTFSFLSECYRNKMMMSTIRLQFPSTYFLLLIKFSFAGGLELISVGAKQRTAWTGWHSVTGLTQRQPSYRPACCEATVHHCASCSIQRIA